MHSIQIEVMWIVQLVHEADGTVRASFRWNAMHERESACGRGPPEGRRMKIALLCAMTFVTLSSLPFASHHGDAIAQESTNTKTAGNSGVPGARLTGSAAPQRMSELVARSAKTGDVLVIDAGSASKSAQ